MSVIQLISREVSKQDLAKCDKCISIKKYIVDTTTMLTCDTIILFRPNNFLKILKYDVIYSTVNNSKTYRLKDECTFNHIMSTKLFYNEIIRDYTIMNTNDIIKVDVVKNRQFDIFYKDENIINKIKNILSLLESSTTKILLPEMNIHAAIDICILYLDCGIIHTDELKFLNDLYNKIIKYKKRVVT